MRRSSVHLPSRRISSRRNFRTQVSQDIKRSPRSYRATPAFTLDVTRVLRKMRAAPIEQIEKLEKEMSQMQEKYQEF